MSKYSDRGPYHFIDFATGASAYYRHVKEILKIIGDHFVTETTRIHEVGCGEGLILQQLRNMGCHVTGNDSDPEAVRMARIFLGENVVDHHEEICDLPASEDLDLILFSDSLEHIKDWEGHVRWAKANSNHILIAIPSEHDKHAERQFQLHAFDKVMDDWDRLLMISANKRHIFFFTKIK